MKKLPFVSLRTAGMKCWVTAASPSWVAILFRDSTAYKRGRGSAPVKSVCSCKGGIFLNLFPHNGLLHDGKVLQEGNEDVGVVGPSNIVCKVPELLSKGQEDFVFIIERAIWVSKKKKKKKIKEKKKRK